MTERNRYRGGRPRPDQTGRPGKVHRSHPERGTYSAESSNGARHGGHGKGQGPRRGRRRRWRGHRHGQPRGGGPRDQGLHHARQPGHDLSEPRIDPAEPGRGQVEPAGEAFPAQGILELLRDGGGFLRQAERSFRVSPEDVFVPTSLLSGLTNRDRMSNGLGVEGVEIEGLAAGRAGGQDARAGGPRHRSNRSHGGRGRHAPRRGGGQSPRLVEVRTVNGISPEEFSERRSFSTLTSVDPFERIRLETDPGELSMRVIDLLTPIGKGQRCLVVAPPRAGKTTLLQKIASAMTRNHPEIHLIVLLVDERPEEVTDMKRSVKGEVIASSSDDVARNHVSVARIVLERSRRLVEIGRDVVILLDSLTRLARAHNTTTPGTGRTLSGGLDARTMEQPRRLFGAARKAEEGGSLTVIATALVDTGSRMDDVIFQEFKGTGNMELVLDRSLFEQRIYPAVDIARSGTRKEEKLFSGEELPCVHRLRRALFEMKPRDAMLKLLEKLGQYPSNAEFLKALAP